MLTLRDMNYFTFIYLFLPLFIQHIFLSTYHVPDIVLNGGAVIENESKSLAGLSVWVSSLQPTVGLHFCLCEVMA